ncbi:copper amine oxidase N-terminal domain-containing protein [Anaeromicrobium sediminis]|nr:copper amine oxidase N-terminal domain-containing protein [Anaeromicrobium sediminis]
MKKTIALVLAMSMALCTIPMASFAASHNSLTKIVTIKDHIELESNSPLLKIENDGGDFGAREVIQLELENAKWLDETKLASTVEGEGTVTLTRKSDSKVEIVADNIAEGSVIKIPLKVEVQHEGEAVVSVTSKSGAVTEGEYTFAHVVEGGTTITLDDTVKFAGSAHIETLTIEESAIGSIDVDELDHIKLELTDDFKLDESSIVIGGSLIGDPSKVQVQKLDNNTIKLNFQDGALVTDLTERGEIEVSGLRVKTTSDSEEGTVYMTVKSNDPSIKTTNLEVGEYKEYEVIVEADDEPTEIFSGTYVDGVGTVDEAHELVKLTMEEEVLGSWTDGRIVNVQLPKEVKILNVIKSGDPIADEEIDENEFEFIMTNSSKKKLELTFYVSVEAGFQGDIKALVTSRGLEKDYEVVLGKAIAPVTIQTEVVNIKAGLRDQEIGKITITENKAKGIQEGHIVIELEEHMEWDHEPTVKVVQGDLEIDKYGIEVEDNLLTITVDSQSEEPSVIEITGINVNVDNSIAIGKVMAEIKGDGLIQNGYDKSLPQSKSYQLRYMGRFSKDYYVELEVANVYDDTTLVNQAQFVIGQKEYKVGEETKIADVAPYIKDGRTMLPVRYVADSIGVEDNNIMWDGKTRTVTIFKDHRIVQIKIGSNKLMVNGMTIMMDTVAEIKDGRTMLPVSFIARALGAEVEWHGATRTVTIR